MPVHAANLVRMIRPQRKPATLDLQEALRCALALHRGGQLAEAEDAYQAVLAAAPDNFDALHLCGVLKHQRGQPAEALGLIARALATNSRSAAALSNHGIVLTALDRLEEAVVSYDKAVAINPDYAEAFNNRGNALGVLRRLNEAIASYDRALALRPHYLEAQSNRASCLRLLGQNEEALAAYNKAVVLAPDNAELLNYRGSTLRDLQRPAEAIASFDRAIALKPDYVEALIGRGNAMQELQRNAEALADFDRAIAIKPDFAEAYSNRGNVLRDLNRREKALASFAQAIALKPGYDGAYNNRGNVLLDLNRHADALADYDRAIELAPDNTDALVNRSNALTNLGRFAEALESCERAIALKLDLAEAHWNKALTSLLLGDFERGWPAYEWRWRRNAESGHRDFSQPLWLGEQPLRGKTILLHAEQGFGDAIQFVRYVPLVAAEGARVILEVPNGLKPMLTGFNGVSTLVGRNESLPAFDVHCPLLSLPLAFKTTLAGIPASIPYLHAPPERVAAWRERLPPEGGLRVGVAWSGKPTHKNDHNRTIALSRLAPLLAQEGCEFICLQNEFRDADRPLLARLPQLRCPGEAFVDFADTASVMASLDLVITVDTAIAHLAGALGKPVWILLSHVLDWRWLVGREDSPWYPTARLFRQPMNGDWEGVIGRVQPALAALAQAARPAG